MDRVEGETGYVLLSGVLEFVGNVELVGQGGEKEAGNIRGMRTRVYIYEIDERYED